MEEKTLLVEIEKDKERVIERKLEEQRKRYKEEIAFEEKNPQDIRLFSAKTYPTTLPKMTSKVKSDVSNEGVNTQKEFSKSIERPNYDFIEELTESEKERVYVVEREEKTLQPARKPSLFKKIVVGILFGILGIWSVVNIAKIDVLSSQVAEVSSEYSMNLLSYLNNLKNLDATNSENMQNLLNTIPDQDLSAGGIEKQSNWFDRFCNFLGGLFGG